MTTARLVIYSLVGLMLASVEADYTTWQFWSIIGLIWASEKTIEIEYNEIVVAVVEQYKKEKEDGRS
jgi:hypothetical protein